MGLPAVCNHDENDQDEDVEVSDELDDLDDEEREELHRSIEAGYQEGLRGEDIPLDDFLQRLRSR